MEETIRKMIEKDWEMVGGRQLWSEWLGRVSLIGDLQAETQNMSKIKRENSSKGRRQSQAEESK